MARYLSEGRKAPAIDEALAKELQRFSGQWVAVQGNRVVGSGGSATEAIEAARRQSVTDPLVFRVSANIRRLRM